MKDAAEIVPATGQLSLFHQDKPEPIVVAYGMGVDSTAMLIGLYQRGIRPDLILFADTGSEKPETYAYLPIINAWLESIGWPQVTVLKRNSPRAGDTSLHGECLRKSILPSLAYGMHSCSLKWKVDPQWSLCKRVFGWRARQQCWDHGPTIVKMIGYDAGAADGRRVKNAVGKWPPGHRYVYPLVEWGWDRERCIQEIEAAGLPVPPKSACFMCPASKKHEIDWLADKHPELAAIAVEMEHRAHARGLRSTVGLGRRFAWNDYLMEQGCSSVEGLRPFAVKEVPVADLAEVRLAGAEAAFAWQEFDETGDSTEAAWLGWEISEDGALFRRTIIWSLNGKEVDRAIFFVRYDADSADVGESGLEERLVEVAPLVPGEMELA